MRIPLDWLKEYLDLGNLTPTELGDAFTQIGLMLDKPFDGKVFEVEHRFDRSDWLSILGCARDLAAYLKVDLKVPPTYTKEGKKPQANQIVDIKVECPDVVNRFNTRVFRNIKVKASPDWMKNRLGEYGIPSINNIVDITNYVMIELGQPMHAQDLAKLQKQEIVIRKAHPEEKLCTFLGDEVTLYPEAFVLTQNGVATVLGGIVGGRDTGVDATTGNIVLDAGNYDQTIIRKVSRKLKIQNETVLRYDKFLHPYLTQYALDRATYLILELAGGDYYQNIDWNPKETKPKEMTLTKSRILKLAGFELPDKRISDILARLGYQITHQSAESFKVTVPYFRTDVEVEDDIVSDILRINGYAKIPAVHIQNSPPKEITPKIYTFEDTLRDALTHLGAHEHITDPLVSRKESSAGDQIMLENSQNSQKNALRTKIAETLRELVPNYTKNQINSGVVFEVGMVYTHAGDKGDYLTYKETRVLECLLFDQTKNPKDLHKKTSSLLSSVVKNLGLEGLSYKKPSDMQEAKIVKGENVLGLVRYNGFTLYTEKLLAEQKHVSRILSDIQNPNSIQTSFIIPRNLPVGSIIDTLLAESSDITKVNFLEEYTGKEFTNDNRSVLLELNFKPEVKPGDATKLIRDVVLKLKKTHDISIRD